MEAAVVVVVGFIVVVVIGVCLIGAVVVAGAAGGADCVTCGCSCCIAVTVAGICGFDRRADEAAANSGNARVCAGADESLAAGAECDMQNEDEDAGLASTVADFAPRGKAGESAAKEIDNALPVLPMRLPDSNNLAVPASKLHTTTSRLLITTQNEQQNTTNTIQHNQTRRTNEQTSSHIAQQHIVLAPKNTANQPRQHRR